MKVRLRSLVIMFVVSHFLMLAAAFYPSTLISQRDISFAILTHVIALGAFMSGALADARASRRRSPAHTAIQLPLPKRFFFLCYIFTAVGLIVSLLQLSRSTSLADYLRGLNAGFDIELRHAFLRSSAEGGVPGIVKMWANSTLAVVLLCCSFLYFYDLDPKSRRKLRVVLLLAFSTLALKTVISLDRLSIMACALALIYLLRRQGIALKGIIACFLILALVFANYLSGKRLEGYGILDFVLLYFYLGFANLELLIQSLEGHTYGFSTFLSPINFALRSLGFAPIFEPDYSWTWNPAQYGVGYTYMDFGYLFPLMYFGLGMCFSYIDRCAYRGRLLWVAIYFVVLYGGVSFLFVPAIRGLEFWVAIIVCLAIPRFSGVRPLGPGEERAGYSGPRGPV